MCKNLFLCLLVFFLTTSKSDCFIPAKIISYVIGKADSKLKADFGYSVETLVHEDIIKRGIIRSVVKYFYDQPNGKNKINLNKTNTEYLNIKNIYYDYYGVYLCVVNLEKVIKNEFQFEVASVDFSPDTKDLPYAHFDAETFYESNLRVIDYMQIVHSFLSVKDYSNARKFLGKILHTIHDFYYHSNWVEMGNYNRINSDIGTIKFNKQPVVKKSDNLTCVSNCTITEIQCSSFVNTLVVLIETIGIRTSFITCPIKYFKCKGNLAVLNKLVSGFYVDQGLSKPDGLFKCSHGGILDRDSFKPAQGGINKDSGYYLFSPHADLHLIAAYLAINHTQFIFEQIRNKIGDVEYSNFLDLKLSNSFLNEINNYIQICSGGNKLEEFSEYFFSFCIVVVLILGFKSFIF